MQIISHRGLWRDQGEKNSLKAFERSFSLGFGTETDLRDQGGKLVISHDMPTADALSCEAFFEVYKTLGGGELPLALNIKADGLQGPLAALLEAYDITNYFVFDMSIPEQVVYRRSGMKYYARQSELEPSLVLADQAQGLWLDGFEGIWFSEEVVAAHLQTGRKVCIVSPELHRRDHLAFWASLATWGIASNPLLTLCTDLPEQAKEVFRAVRN